MELIKYKIKKKDGAIKDIIAQVEVESKEKTKYKKRKTSIPKFIIAQKFKNLY